MPLCCYEGYVCAVDKNWFKEFCDAFSRLTADNTPSMLVKLIELGPSLAPVVN